MSEPLRVRRAGAGDAGAVGRMCAALWPDATAEEHARDVAPTLAGRPAGTLPVVVLVAELDARPIAFVEVGLRSHADGCDPARPVGFVEGWYVEPAHRGRGVGRALMRAAEEWARGEGCTELASDTWLDNEPSQRAHEALGFEVVDRCVHFRKSLR